MEEKIKLVRNKKNGTYSIKININEDWKLFLANKEGELKDAQIYEEGNSPKTISVECSPKQRMYFEIKTDNESIAFSEGRLNMQGAFNMRDLGGFKTKEGKFVSYGRVYRSDDLFHLTSDDLDLLRNIGLDTVIDFRSNEEIKQAPDKTLENWLVKKLPINPGSMTNASVQEILKYSEEQVKNYVKGIYEYLGDGKATDEYKMFFATLLNNENGASVFHCSAGKDRTGMGAALFLYALGIDEELIYGDYLLSNEYTKDKYAAYLEKYPQLEGMFRVEKEYLQEAFKRLKKNFGSIMNYIEKELGVDIDKLKELYLRQ